MFRDGFIYPLKDAERYDDNHGEGFDHALVACEGSGGCYIVDCWIVNSTGEKHPGYDSCPIPVQADDVETEAGVFMGNIHGEGESLTDGMIARGGF